MARTLRGRNVALAVGMIVLAACGSDSASPADTSAPAPAPAPTSAPAETATSAPARADTSAPAETAPETTVEAAGPLATDDRTVAPDEPWLLYQTFTISRALVSLTRPDGTGSHRVDDTEEGDQTNPDWSPDGQRIVFAHGNGSTDDLWTVNADGTAAELLVGCDAPCVALDDPAWWPDGSSVLYSRLIDQGGVGVGTLERVDVETGDIEVLLTAGQFDFFAGQRPSPDGTQVVMEIVHTDGSGLFETVTGVELAMVDLTTVPPTVSVLTAPDLYAETAAWSPDGSLIAYAALPSADTPEHDLFTMHPDGSAVTRLTTLTDAGGGASHPEFTLDGAGVTFMGTLEGEDVAVLVTVDLADGALRPAVGTTYVAGAHPRWRPVP